MSGRSRGVETRFHAFELGDGKLSPIQLKILQLVALGHTDEKIGRLTSLTLGQVKAEVRHLRWRLDANSRQHAVHLGYQLGLLKVFREHG